MRIISKFHDFYDAVMKTGMDREIVYVRDNKEVEIDSHGIDFTTEESGNHYSAKLYFLGYCGQIFKVIDLKYEVKVEQFNNHTYRKVFFDYNEFKKFMLEMGYGSKYDFDRSRFWPSKYQRFDQFDTSKLLDLFHIHQTPLFLVTNIHRWRERDKTTLTLGPSLKELEFFKFKDAYTTYQDIFQYVAGVLNKPETKMVKISDRDKIHKHGFDKWSFRQKGPKK